MEKVITIYTWCQQHLYISDLQHHIHTLLLEACSKNNRIRGGIHFESTPLEWPFCMEESEEWLRGRKASTSRSCSSTSSSSLSWFPGIIETEENEENEREKTVEGKYRMLLQFWSRSIMNECIRSDAPAFLRQKFEGVVREVRILGTGKDKRNVQFMK